MLTITESELRYRRLFETAQDGILILDAETGVIVDVNPFLINMLGYSRESFVGIKFWQMNVFKDIESSQDAFDTLAEDQYIRYDNLPLRAKDGKRYLVEFVANVFQAGSEKMIQCNIRDITARMQVHEALLKNQALLRELSIRDHLTGLFNRRYLEETLERELLRASRKQLLLGIIMLDVDNFKRYNDRWSHLAGDAILHEIGGLLLEHVRGDDVPSRYGGDEFVIVMPDSSPEVTSKRAEQLRKHAHNLHISYEGKTIEAVTLSLGVAVFPYNGMTSTEILIAADNALYRAKHHGGNQVVQAKIKSYQWDIPVSLNER
jgi:diguanylate cyclase (GGDEF)-like protein/PAS domain S-box-containing protein